MISIEIAAATKRSQGAILAQIQLGSRTVPLCQTESAQEYVEVFAPDAQGGLFVLDAAEYADSFDPAGTIVWGGLAYSAAEDPENIQIGEFLWNLSAATIALKPP